MAKKEVLKVEHVGMKFNLSQEKIDDLKDYIIKLIKRQISYNEFWALKDVNFTLNKGDRLGILGLNGAGKSTLLKVIAGVLKATEGTVMSKGKIALLQRRFTWSRECETNNTVTPLSNILIIFASLFLRNFASPTESTSSKIRMSGSTNVATENPSLDFIPEE